MKEERYRLVHNVLGVVLGGLLLSLVVIFAVKISIQLHACPNESLQGVRQNERNGGLMLTQSLGGRTDRVSREQAEGTRRLTR